MPAGNFQYGTCRHTGWTGALTPRDKKEVDTPLLYFRHCHSISTASPQKWIHLLFYPLPSYSCFLRNCKTLLYFPHWFEHLTSLLFFISFSAIILGVNTHIDDIFSILTSKFLLTLSIKAFVPISKSHRPGHTWDSVDVLCYLGIPEMIDLQETKDRPFSRAHILFYYIPPGDVQQNATGLAMLIREASVVSNRNHLQHHW